jgi:integral membrane protein
MGRNKDIFFKIGIAEAISFLLLLGVAMPLKYGLGLPEAVKYTGWAHGLLFMGYILWLFLAADEQKWGFKVVALGFIAALVPFGPFWFHKRY